MLIRYVKDIMTQLSESEIREIINSDPLTKRHLTIDKLKSGELTWKEYIDSMTPEEQEEERQYRRERANKWWSENKDMINAKRRGKVKYDFCGITVSRATFHKLKSKHSDVDIDLTFVDNLQHQLAYDLNQIQKKQPEQQEESINATRYTIKQCKL